MHKIVMEITLLIMETSWKHHGNVFLNFCGNLVNVSRMKRGNENVQLSCLTRDLNVCPHLRLHSYFVCEQKMF